MSEKIEISFDDFKKPEKITIDLPDLIKTGRDTKLKVARLTSRGDRKLSMQYESGLTFPTGIDSGFRMKSSIQLADRFMNRILFNDSFVVLTSATGKVYFVDTESGLISGNLNFEGEVFEKTGVVIENSFYINSVVSIFCIKGDIEKRESATQIYSVTSGYFIWTDLNAIGRNIFFIEYNPQNGFANLVALDSDNGRIICKNEFQTNSSDISDICSFGNMLIFIAGSEILCWSVEQLKFLNLPDLPEVSGDSIIAAGSNQIFIYSANDMIYGSFMPLHFKTTGISRRLINSIGVIGNYFVISKSDGWEIINDAGRVIYRHDDNDVNILQAMNVHIICLSIKNKLVMYNTNNFNEAEGIVLKSDNSDTIPEIISAAMSDTFIFALTKDGTFALITNDKLNINV